MKALGDTLQRLALTIDRLLLPVEVAAAIRRVIVDDGVGLPGRQAAAWDSSVELGLKRISRAMHAVGGTPTVHPLRARGVRLHAAVPVAVRNVR